MSGGVAWVLDEQGDFAGRCNGATVELEELDEDDEQELKALVAEHLERTGSAVAERLLAVWEESLRRFVKVMPREYRRALERRRDPRPDEVRV
jgi:glutamate synthase domain-containing protein 3